MPIHDQGYRRYGGAQAPRGPRVGWSSRAPASATMLAQARVPRPAARRPGCRSSSAPSRSTSPANFPQAAFLAPTAETFRQFLEQQDIFVFFITVYVGAGLIANDRRANALQIYLSKPLTRAEYIFGKLGDPDDVPAARHLGAGDPAAHRADRRSPATSRSSRNNLFLFPAITVFAVHPGRAGRRRRCWRCRRCRRAAATSASCTPALIFFTPGDLRRALRVVTAQHRAVVDVVLGATSTQVGDVIFRLPLRYDTPWPVSLLMLVVLIAVSGLGPRAARPRRRGRRVSGGRDRRRRSPVEVVRPGHRPERRHGDRAAGHHRPARPERRRQVHVHEADHRPAQAEQGRRSRVLGEPIWRNPALYFRIGFCPGAGRVLRADDRPRVGDGARPPERRSARRGRATMARARARRRSI